MEFLIAILLILVCMLFAFRKKESGSRNQRVTLHKGYLAGLNFLLNEEPDKAVDVFIKMLEVDSDTVETHLALGSLFRRRGEVDRAIRIHQNLIARPGLLPRVKLQALIALGDDYLSAGVLDRAERVFQEAITLDSESSAGLDRLLDIYQQEKEWDKAIDIAAQLVRLKGQSYKQVIAHYYCEKAELALSLCAYHDALGCLQKALSADSGCYRAHYIQANILILQQRYKEALRHLHKLKDLRIEFLPEILEQLSTCYKQLGDKGGLVKDLREGISFGVSPLICLQLSSLVVDDYQRLELGEMLRALLLKNPSIEGLYVYFQFVYAQGETAQSSLDVIDSVVEALYRKTPSYQCKACGYSGNMLQWQCPSCKEWGCISLSVSLASKVK